jgi:hypothetical protein
VINRLKVDPTAMAMHAVNTASLFLNLPIVITIHEQTNKY